MRFLTRDKNPQDVIILETFNIVIYSELCAAKFLQVVIAVRINGSLITTNISAGVLLSF